MDDLPHPKAADAIARLVPADTTRAVAILTRIAGDIDLAEDAVQDALAAALAHWPSAGVPPSPIGWLVTTAKRRLIDRLRRESSREARHAEAAALVSLARAVDDGDDDLAGAIADDRLRMLFTCCHPALAPQVRVALTLRLVGGLSTAAIARAFLVSEATMAQRLTRAKHKIRDARIPYRVPAAADLPERLAGVLAAVYLVFNEGYTASSGDRLTRGDLCAEAIRLGRLLRELLPDEPEVAGLLALMLLVDARRETRTSADGDLVLLGDQDRAHWDRARIDEGHALVRECLRVNRPGPYQLQAAIQAVHTDAPTAAATDWPQILALYDQLLIVQPTPVVALNRAVAVAEVRGPGEALALVDALPLGGFHVFHAARADLLRRLGRAVDAAVAYDAAIAATANETERAFLRRRRDAR
jgi:RNA polymerase sigma-70 factor (ECF subfamily)